MYGSYRHDPHHNQRPASLRGGARGNSNRQASQDYAVERSSLLDSHLTLIAEYLKYINDYNLKEEKILDYNTHHHLKASVSPQNSMAVVQEFLQPGSDRDPSKMILKLCQVCFKGSHRFVALDQGNKKLRVVDFMINNKAIYQFTFECSNNKIANRATAYEAIKLLFPKIYERILVLTKENINQLDLREFEYKQSNMDKSKDQSKKDSDIFFKLFNCEFIDFHLLDSSGTLAGFHCSNNFDDTFLERVRENMYSTISNNMLQKNAGRSLNFNITLTKKITAENTLDKEGKNEYKVEAVDNHAKKYFTTSIICKNKNEAKNACGLKFIELFARPAFKSIWENKQMVGELTEPIGIMENSSNSIGKLLSPDPYQFLTVSGGSQKTSLGSTNPSILQLPANTGEAKTEGLSSLTVPLNLSSSLGLNVPSPIPMTYYGNMYTQAIPREPFIYPMIALNTPQLASVNASNNVMLFDDILPKPIFGLPQHKSQPKRYDTSAEPFYLPAPENILSTQYKSDEKDLYTTLGGFDEDEEDKWLIAISNTVQDQNANNGLDLFRSGKTTLLGTTNMITRDNPDKGNFLNNTNTNTTQLQSSAEEAVGSNKQRGSFSPFGSMQPTQKIQQKGFIDQTVFNSYGGIGAQPTTDNIYETVLPEINLSTSHHKTIIQPPLVQDRNNDDSSEVSVDESFERKKKLKVGVSKDDNDSREDNLENHYSEESSESDSEGTNQDSIEKIFKDFVTQNLSPGNDFDLSRFKNMHKLKMKPDWKGTYLYDSEFFAKVSEILSYNGIYLDCMCNRRNDETKEFSFRIFIEKLSEPKEHTFIVEAYADLSFNSKLMDFNHCFNYSIYLAIEKSFPSFAKNIAAFTVRTALGLNTDDKSKLAMVPQVGLFWPEDGNISAMVPDRSLNKHLNKSVLPERVISYLPTRSDLQMQNSYNTVSSFSSNTVSAMLPVAMAKDSFDSTMGILESCGPQKLIKSVKEYFSTGDVTSNRQMDEELSKWNLINGNFSEIFTEKIKKMEPWELKNIFYHDEVKLAMLNTEASYESKIKKKDNFYDTVKKNMLDEDYASVANSFVHTIFKEAMDITYSGDFTLFKLHTRTMIIVEAKVQNNKLRKKLTSLIVLRLYWKELYMRCTQGDFARKE